MGEVFDGTDDLILDAQHPLSGEQDELRWEVAFELIDQREPSRCIETGVGGTEVRERMRWNFTSISTRAPNSNACRNSQHGGVHIPMRPHHFEKTRRAEGWLLTYAMLSQAGMGKLIDLKVRVVERTMMRCNVLLIQGPRRIDRE